VNLLYERAPQGLVTTGQSVLNLVTFGVGAIAGSLLGGLLVEVAGLAWLFRALSIFAAAGLLIFSISQRPRLERMVPEQQP
jgi:MFS family permease